MKSTATAQRRFLMVRIHDRFGKHVSNDIAKFTAMRLAGIPTDAVLIEGPDRNVEYQSVDLAFSHPSFAPVPHGEPMPVVEVTGDPS